MQQCCPQVAVVFSAVFSQRVACEKLCNVERSAYQHSDPHNTFPPSIRAFHTPSSQIAWFFSLPSKLQNRAFLINGRVFFSLSILLPTSLRQLVEFLSSAGLKYIYVQVRWRTEIATMVQAIPERATGCEELLGHRSRDLACVNIARSNASP